MSTLNGLTVVEVLVIEQHPDSLTEVDSPVVDLENFRVGTSFVQHLVDFAALTDQLDKLLTFGINQKHFVSQ